jgi:hypothetical protein
VLARQHQVSQTINGVVVTSIAAALNTPVHLVGDFSHGFVKNGKGGIYTEEDTP